MKKLIRLAAVLAGTVALSLGLGITPASAWNTGVHNPYCMIPTSSYGNIAGNEWAYCGTTKYNALVGPYTYRSSGAYVCSYAGGTMMSYSGHGYWCNVPG